MIVELAVSVAEAPLNVSDPLLVESPRVAAPANSSGLVNVREDELSELSVPPTSFRLPVPSALLLPTRNVPPLTVVPPL